MPSCRLESTSPHWASTLDVKPPHSSLTTSRCPHQLATANHTSLTLRRSLPPPNHPKCSWQSRHMSAQPPHPRDTRTHKKSCSRANPILRLHNFFSTFHHANILLPHNSKLAPHQHSLLHKPNTQLPTLSGHASLREADGVSCTCCKFLNPTDSISEFCIS